MPHANLSRPEFLQLVTDAWAATLNQLFPAGVPAQHEWAAARDILRVLEALGQATDRYGDRLDMTYALLPGSGSFLLLGADGAPEPLMLELKTSGVTYIVRPAILTLEWIGGGDLRWAYFRLEAQRLRPARPMTSRPEGRHYEALTEMKPGVYDGWDVWSAGNLGRDEDDNVIPLPRTARPVHRYLSGGAFLFVALSSPYNQDGSTDDGRHATMGGSAFRAYMEEYRRVHDAAARRATGQAG